MFNETAKKIVDEAVSSFEKAVDFKFSLHIMCVTLYLQSIVTLSTGKIPVVSWGDVESLYLIKILVSIFCYFIMMGYVFRFPYFIFSMAIKFISIKFSYLRSVGWRDIPDMVYKDDVMKYASITKDTEPIRQLEAHRERCEKNQKEMGDLAYLSFAAVVLLAFDHFTGRESFVDMVQTYLASIFPLGLVQAVGYFLVVPLLLIITSDSSVDYDRKDYLENKYLYDQIEESKRRDRG